MKKFRSVVVVLLVATCSVPAGAGSFRERWSNFCERHLVAEHPFQVWLKKLPTSDLVMEYRRQATLLRYKRVDLDEYEMTLAILAGRIQDGEVSESEMVSVQDAVEDYPDPRLVMIFRQFPQEVDARRRQHGR